MRQVVLGVLFGLAVAGIGLFWWQGPARIEAFAPAPPIPMEDVPLTGELPTADTSDLVGPEPPRASELTKEEIRFFRYDRNRDRIITRYEMLSSRTAGFRALDLDGNNLLTFEEWAVATVTRFDTADADGNGQLTPGEFATTAPQSRPRRRPSCSC